MMRIAVIAALVSVSAGQLATKDVVETPLLDMVQQAMGTLQGSDTVESLKEKVTTATALKEQHAMHFKQITADDGAVNSRAKLANVLRQTSKDNAVLEACINNDNCMDTLFTKIDRNNDGTIDDVEYKNYIVDDGTNDKELKEKRQAAAKVLRTLRTADVNGDNVISPQEFAQWRGELDLVEDSAVSYESFDADQDGEVTKSEFAKSILKVVEAKQNKVSDAMKTVKNVISAGQDLVSAAKKHQNLAESFRSASDMNFRQQLQDVPKMNLEGAMKALEEANAQVLKINEAEKKADQFTIKLDGKVYKLEGGSKNFYRKVNHLVEQGFSGKKSVRALVAAQGQEHFAKTILCNSEEGEDTEICDKPNLGAEMKGTSFVESDAPNSKLTEKEQEAQDELEESSNDEGTHLEDGTPVETEILLPEPNKDLPRFRQKKQEVMQNLVSSLTEAERKALLSNSGRKHLRQIMPKHADSFAKGVEQFGEQEAPDQTGDKKTAFDHVLNIGKQVAQPAIDVADLGLQMLLGPKNEFVNSLPQKFDDAMTEFNKQVGNQ